MKILKQYQRLRNNKKSQRRKKRIKINLPVGDRIAVIIPEIFSLMDNYTETISIINLIRKLVLIDNRRVLIDFRKSKLLEINAAVILTAELQRCKQIKPGRGYSTLNGNYPANEAVYKILYDLNFFKIIGVPENGEPETEIEGGDIRIMMQGFTRTDAQRVSVFKELFTLPFEQLTLTAKKRMQGAIIEAIINSLEHAFNAKSAFPTNGKRAWLSGYINRDKSEMAMTIYDQGVGIPESFPTNWKDLVSSLIKLKGSPSDSDLIAYATTAERTSTNQKGRGKGFKTMRQFIDNCNDAELRIYSNKGQFQYDGKNDKIGIDAEASIGGTLVMLRICHTDSEIGQSGDTND